ncbi:MAG: acetyl-CoA carboxylase biotin carboxylase subunit, partial [Candidatus Dadabacteria bacterium]
MGGRIKKILIANRGEIARRIKRACDKLGIKAVNVASEADKEQLFAREADELVVIGPAAPAQSYLSIDRLIKAALDSGCDAVHPGYGFLAENAEFARAVNKAGLIFIGPDPEAIELMGSKTRARECVSKNNVPCVPGSPGSLKDSELMTYAKKLGFPLIVKAVAGGGGRGMRIVRTEKELQDILPHARAEAEKNFSNPMLYLERYIERPRHVEVQVFGDSHGNIVHMGTRDCSIQRRHQKLVEEAPAPALSKSLRDRIHTAACNAAKSVNYKGAGTVEFLVDREEFYFLEMNTRIQVEHPVTEEITGIDLVALQIEVAEGKELPFTQQEITFDGHAIEFRIYAEDPEQNFMPVQGKIRTIILPESEGLRVDSAYALGDKISLYYDALLAKIIIKAKSRSEVLERSRVLLREIKIDGISTTLDFHRWLLNNPAFLAATADVGLVSRLFSSDSIRELKASEIRDPRYQVPVGGAEVKNLYNYQSKKFNTTYTIEVIHRRDGYFMAAPVSADGKRAPNKNCRMSNGLDTVVKALISDVLEKVPPSE